jgi:ABC-type nitrate/sulfonate/bicarbonate transport system substrate-binding protein
MRRFAALLALVALAGGCGDDDGGGGGGGDEGPAEVTVSDTAGVPSAFLEYGVDQGFFEKRDLNVRVQPSQGGATVVPAVVSGDVDIGGSNLVSVLLAQSKDIPVKIVAPGTFVDGDKDFSAIVVAKDSGIREPQDLEGRTLAVNTLKNVAEVTAREALEKEGVDSSKVELTEVDFPDMTAAVEQGRVDAAFAIEPFVTQATASGNRIVLRPYVGTKPGLQIGCYFTSEQYLAENEDVVQRFREGVGETARAIASDPSGFREFLPEASEIPPPAAQEVVLPAWKESSDQASLDLTAELMARYEVTPEKPDTSEAIAE